VVYAGVVLAPGILRNVHPAKQWLSGAAATLARRGRALLRPST
jgi:hypothetical protein